MFHASTTILHHGSWLKSHVNELFTSSKKPSTAAIY
jgi:hypothetical protein